MAEEICRYKLEPTDPPSMALKLVEEVNLGVMGWVPTGYTVGTALIPNESQYPRIDLVVYEGSVLMVYLGTPQPAPLAPQLPKTNGMRTILASILVPPGRAFIQEADITRC